MIEMQTTYPLDNPFALALRLETMRQCPPAPLPHVAARQRDGPVKDQQPMPAPKRGSGAHSAPPAHSWNHRSKGT